MFNVILNAVKMKVDEHASSLVCDKCPCGI